MKGGVIDTEKAVRIVMQEFRAGKLGLVTLDAVPVETEEASDTETPLDTSKEEGRA